MSEQRHHFMLNSNVVQSHSNNLYCSFITTIKRIKQPASIEGIQWTLLANWACHKGRRSRPRPRPRPSVCGCCAAPFKLTEFPHELNFPAKRNERKKKRIFHASTGRQDVAGRWACWPYYRVLEAHCRHFSHFAAVCRRCCCCCTINDTWQVPYNLYRTKKSTSFPSYFFYFYYFSVSASVKFDMLNLPGKYRNIWGVLKTNWKKLKISCWPIDQLKGIFLRTSFSLSLFTLNEKRKINFLFKHFSIFL